MCCSYVLWINSGDMASANLPSLLCYFECNHALIAFAVEVARADSVDGRGQGGP